MYICLKDIFTKECFLIFKIHLDSKMPFLPNMYRTKMNITNTLPIYKLKKTLNYNFVEPIRELGLEGNEIV